MMDENMRSKESIGKLEADNKRLREEVITWQTMLREEVVKRETYQAELNELNDKYNDLISKHKVIAQFLPEYQKITDLGYTVQKLYDELISLQQFSLQQAKRISELEDEIKNSVLDR